MRVLLIEDSQTDRTLVRAALADAADADLHIDDAGTLTGGLEMLADRVYDVVLLDLALPDSWGVDTVLQVTAVAEGIPVIVLTGRMDGTIEDGVLRAGAHAYLSKHILANGGGALVEAIVSAASGRET